MIKGFDLRIKTGRHERAHVQHGAHMRTTSPNNASAPQGPTVAMEGCHADQGRDLLPRERPQLGEFQQQRPGTHRPNTRDTLQQVVVFAPQRASPEHRLQVVVQRGDARIEPGNMGLDVLGQALARPREAILFRRPHADQLLAASQEGAQLLRLGVAQGPGCRADHVGKVGQGAGIQGIRLGQLPRGTCKIARLPWVHNDDGKTRCGQCRRGDPLQTAGGFQHNQGGVEGLQPFPERHDSIGVVRHGPSLPRGAYRNVQLGFGHINTDKTWRVTHTNSCRPALADTGSTAPNNCTGLRSPGRDDPRSAPVSTDPGYIGLSRPGTE